jgi:predicted DNA-binding protein
MKLPPRLDERITIRLKKETFSILKNEAERENITPVEKIREILEDYIQTENAKDGVPEIEKALKKVLQPYVDRLAGLSVHSGIAAGTSESNFKTGF